MAKISRSTGGAALYSKAKSSSAGGLMKYPGDLFSPGAEPFVIFNIFDAVARGGARKDTIAMYMPPTLKVSYNAQYEEVSLDFEKFLAAAKSLLSAEELEKLAGDALAGVIGGVLKSNIPDEVAIANGRSINPHMAVLFRGVGFRSFQLDFQMNARNAAESDAIQNIIYAFKYYMHPHISADAKRYFEWPEMFTIEFYSPKSEYLFKIFPSALTNMEVDYAGSGVPSFFASTGAPVDIRMSLQFKEMNILTKDLLDEESGV